MSGSFRNLETTNIKVFKRLTTTVSVIGDRSNVRALLHPIFDQLHPITLDQLHPITFDHLHPIFDHLHPITLYQSTPHHP
ncbi:hypothetical protein Pmani_030608 [Petrolisthes manimaculis]|nr:hypothetical protein Pmani_030608 [Petrolisthes manimaculis]